MGFLVLALPTLAGCAPSESALVVAGSVDDEVVRVTLPRISTPTPDLEAGIAAARSSGGNAASGKAASQATGQQGGSAAKASPRSGAPGSPGAIGTTSFARVAAVPVAEGARVSQGQLVTSLDDGALAADVAAAGAAVTAARRKVDVLDDAIAKTHDSEAELLDKRREVTASIRTLTRKRAELRTRRSQASAAAAKVSTALRDVGTGLARLDAAVSAITAKLAELPPDQPALEPIRRRLTAQQTAVIGRRAALAGKRREAQAAGAELRKALGALNAGLAQITTGLSKARQGVAGIDAGLSRVREARRSLRHTRALARTGVDAAAVRQRTAQLAAAQAQVSSPVDGIVVETSHPGEVLATGATLVTIRADAAPTITTWVPPEQLDRVCVGGPVSVHGDWMTAGSQAPGAVTWIGDSAEYPPSRLSSDQVHLTRAVPVRVTAEGGSDRPALPPGAPVDVRFGSCPSPGPSPTSSTSSSPRPTLPRENP